jgi:hypothetical protein
MPQPIDPFDRANVEDIEKTNRESVETMHSLIDELKSVQEHENILLDDDEGEPPLFVPKSKGFSA